MWASIPLSLAAGQGTPLTTLSPWPGAPGQACSQLGRALLDPGVDPGGGEARWGQWQLPGDGIRHLERLGFLLVGMKGLQAPEGILTGHYPELQRQPCYPALISYLSSGPMAAMVREGPSVVHTSRAMIQHTNLAEAAPSPIWRDYGAHISRTTTPSRHSVEGAQREIQLRFQSSELGVPKLTFSASQHPASCHKITELEECLHIFIFQMATHFGEGNRDQEVRGRGRIMATMITI